MTALLASIRKEILLFTRDWHALLVLFLMPALFIVIMSLALQNRLAGEGELQLAGWLDDRAASAASAEFTVELGRNPQLDLEDATGEAALSTSGKLFRIELTTEFDAALAGQGEGPGVRLHFAPALAQRDRLLISAAVQQSFARYNTTQIARELGYDRAYAESELLRSGFIASAAGDPARRPNATQQSVPAWLIFAMFFIAIPISTTLIQERQQRTLIRLRSLGARLSVIYTAKLVPYGAVNLLQLLLMLAIGAWLLPLLGARGLSLAVNLPALLVIGCATSLAALGYACLIAALVRSIEQATVISGAGNILLAAVGGVMIPTFVMPPAMQALAQLSPMAWALEGFVSVLVRDGGLADIAAPAARLLVFAALLWLAAILMIKRSRQNG